MVPDDDNSKNDASRSKQSRSRGAKPIYVEPEGGFKYNQFLGLLLVVGFLVIGTAAGSYAMLRELMETPCLGCLGLYPSFEIEFTFETVDDKPHPDWILDALEDGPVFIEFTQNDIRCPPCARMRPKVAELIDEYSDTVTFFIINVNENENEMTFQDTNEVIRIDDEFEVEVYNMYDIQNVGKGSPATPTYVLFTLEKDFDGTIRPYFGVGYGEFRDEDAQKTKEALAEILDFTLKRHEFNLDKYLAQE